MVTSNPSADAYAPVSEYLQQGDIFCQKVVTPVVDTEKRIFRTSDGQHGSVVFADGVSAKVFEESELIAKLNECARTPLHTDPFCLTEDGFPEMVVVHSTLTSYFIIATQTCDICGVDRKPLPTAIILPVLTVQDICRNQRLPFQSLGNKEMTIESFLELNAGAAHLRTESDSFRYPTLLREVFSNWKPGKQFEPDRNRLRNYMDQLHEKGWMYFLKQDDALKVPESYVDFSVAYTVPTFRLNELKASRIARLADNVRNHFSREFADMLSRIALPTPIKPEGYK